MSTPIAINEDARRSNVVIGAPSSSRALKIIYMECQKNHAIGIGGITTDGCGEFMAGGEDGTLEALKCCACNCHRNFHRKIQILQPAVVPNSLYHPSPGIGLNDNMYGAQAEAEAGAGIGIGLGTGAEKEEGSELVKKRFRTKFTAEQKEKMLQFAEKGEWKIQKMEEVEVRNFCQEIGIKRKVLKVWMHNNKYHYAKKTAATPSSTEN